ncbi:phosphatidylinositol-specific phospholipase C/glycerophosphodiester phosphodiesterase family protein [Labilibaculum euxinus]|uniref:Altered inheritance of mitochondria protein 6 n=1 Tax=Labilibaculum euxinus TaxID=2686357 RepID=A0A7M4D9W5_9BACT|nr:phosphatidylinositol-specific phospholipase C/glycerophosphodiester phosphodiesterase family protein [Labilibaculum euxinus]MUP39444.1 hypothetical protein [Labilibaculum euxinus]MVB08649.1 hypothetical protein [Labilibaculum euxinus]
MMVFLRIVLVAVAAVICSVTVYAQQCNFKGGHSHNDYLQKRPLFEALENGMVSIEADVFLRSGKLLVGHNENNLRLEQTLEHLYLNPLLQLTRDSSKKFNPIILMIDIKDKGKETYTELKKMLIPYLEMLTCFSDNKIRQKLVTIIISGDRPVEILRKETLRYAFLDGRISDIDKFKDSNLFLLISDDWNTYFTWKGKEEISKKDYEKLCCLTEACHSQNKMIRFWGMPDELSESVNYWNVLRNAGVDLIGCDCPSCFSNYLNKLDEKQIKK